MNKQKCAEGYRICVACKKELPLTNEFFSKDKNRKSGMMYRCKNCDQNRPDDRTWEYRKEKMGSEKLKEHYYKNNIRNKLYRKTIAGKALFVAAQYKNTDKRKGLQNDITQKDVIFYVSQPCVYCGHPATGVDRINNSIGHIKSNCVPCCKECNVARMDNFSHEEMLEIGKTLRKIKNKRIQYQ